MIKLCGLFVSTLIFLPTNFSPSSEVGLWILFSRYNIFFPVVLVQATASLSETPLIPCLPTSTRDLCVPPTCQRESVDLVRSLPHFRPLSALMFQAWNQTPSCPLWGSAWSLYPTSLLLVFSNCIGVLSVPAPAKFLTALHLLCLLPGVLLSSFQSSVQTSYPQGGNLWKITQCSNLIPYYRL